MSRSFHGQGHTEPFVRIFPPSVFRAMGAQDVAFEVTVRKMHVWPLELLDLGDAEQMVVVFNALRDSPLAVQYFLEHFFLPSPRPQ